MKLVALDLSLTRTGLAWVETHPASDGGIEVGTLNPSLGGEQRLIWLRDEILTRTRACDAVALEGYSYNSRAKGEQLGELGGVVRVALHEHGRPFVAIPPAKVKKYATGLGNANKDIVMASASRRADRDFACSDESDAFWILQMAMAHYLPEHPEFLVLPAAHQKALRSIEWPDIIERTRT